MDPALLEALGLPERSIGDRLPSPLTALWRRHSFALRNALSRQGITDRIRTPSVLWTLLHRCPRPRRATWRSLLEGRTWDLLVERVRDRRAASGTRVAVWNPRWLVDPTTDVNDAKRWVIKKWLDAGRVTLLSETHGPAET